MLAKTLRFRARFEKRLKKVLEKGAAFEARRRKARRRITVFLLGPGFPREQLAERKRLQKQLRRYGINAIVMETLPQWTSPRITDKFRDILSAFSPNVIVAIFTKRGKPLGVTFELGYLAGYYGVDKLRKMLAICVERGVDEIKLMTQYVRELLPENGRTFDRNQLLDTLLTIADDVAVELDYL